MRTLRIENRDKIDEIITSCKTCYVAMSENDRPYVLPMNFALDGDVVILHSAQSGRMWETVKKNSHVCINWTQGEELAWQDERSGCSYRVKSKSVLVEGAVEFVDNYDEKERCLHLLMAQYSDRKFKFNAPAVKNVGIIKVRIEKISAKEFGAKAVTPWNS
ncbi:MAG TPA: pyridoxamine 5'-phosphate oxidase family protein [Mariniphaga anaerophila]|uniref:Pyridoxamine 5'-phosphate oxidase family protein n=1 Tax=Mariniphaga anaerophila TaxID=1484053 RepID=A0A831LSQ6_9BACT|nr:pyridoxamine 5'-phosphate oxidase family protein [Mariniphaga anaerophila]